MRPEVTVPGAAAFAFGNAGAIRKPRVQLPSRAGWNGRAYADDITKMPLSAIRPPTERHNNATGEVFDLNHDYPGDPF
jgi:hypothetical protein